MPLGSPALLRSIILLQCFLSVSIVPHRVVEKLYTDDDRRDDIARSGKPEADDGDARTSDVLSSYREQLMHSHCSVSTVKTVWSMS